MNIRDFELEVFFGTHEFQAPYLLAQSDCESVSIAELLAFEPAAADRFLASRLGYTEVYGDPELRALTAGLYETMSAEHILMHAGAQEAIFIFMNVFLQPGDHLICQMPAYQSLYEIARAVGCRVTPWPLHDEPGGWMLDLAALESQIRPETTLIVVNSPHNPTGYTLSEDEMTAVIDIADRHGITIFADEVYGALRFDTDAPRWFCDGYARAVSLNVLSKSYGLPGLRIGWVASHDTDLLEKMARFKHYLSICNSAPSEYLARIAVKHADRLASRSLALIRENRRSADDFFDAFSDLFEMKPAAGGPVAFHKLLLDRPVAQFCDDLVREAGVLLLPGSVYDSGGNYFRMGYGRRSFQANLAELRTYLQRTYR